MQLAELAQFAVGVVALFGGREGKDAVGRPFVWADDGRFGVPADEGELVEVVVLSRVRDDLAEDGTASYMHQLLQRVDDLVRLDVAEDVDDLAVARLPLWVDDIAQREWLPRVRVELACCRSPRLRVEDNL